MGVIRGGTRQEGVISRQVVVRPSAGPREVLARLVRTGRRPRPCSAEPAPRSLKQLLCCLPQVDVPAGVTYDNVFRLIVMQFLDPYNFDVRSVKKSCVHIVHPGGRVIRIDTYNLFYRDGLEQRLADVVDTPRLTRLTVGQTTSHNRTATYSSPEAR